MHNALYQLPIWGLALLLYLLTGFVIDAGRETLEGFSYNVSHAARYGDIGLIVIILIAVTVLKRVHILPSWLTSDLLHLALAFVCLGLGVIIEVGVLANSNWQLGQAVDIYHNLAIVPLFLYLLAILLPVTYLYGRSGEKTATILLLLLWLALVIYDASSGRLNQREWLEKNGYSDILKNR
ncbi:hypothetical protein HGA34_02335 [Candidatus Falkowbacteria bacterium]|nr:hypothetical protein [Candidatus Falkowbacteria bacterium]